VDYPPPILPDDLVFENELSDFPTLVNSQKTENSPRRQNYHHDCFGNKRGMMVVENVVSKQEQLFSQLGENIERLFEKFCLTELAVEDGLESFELGNESIEILRNRQHMQELRYMGEYEKTGIERFIQVRKNVQASAKGWFLRIKKNVQEKSNMSKRNPFNRDSIRDLVQKGEQAMMDPENELALKHVNSRLIDEFSEICDDTAYKYYTSPTFTDASNLNYPSTFSEPAPYLQLPVNQTSTRTQSNSSVGEKIDYFDADSERSSVKNKQ